ncbi:MAG: hypothetical protein IJ137_10265 [Eubacterium sp.]|nr:hypothetical protein [Eubacterium sp.]
MTKVWNYLKRIGIMGTMLIALAFICLPVSAGTVSVVQQDFTTSKKTAERTARVVKTGTQTINFPTGVDKGYLAFTAPKDGTYTFTFSDLTKKPDYNLAVGFINIMTIDGGSIFIANVNTQGGIDDVMWVSNPPITRTIDGYTVVALSSRYGEIMLAKKQKVFIYFSTNAASLKLNIKGKALPTSSSQIKKTGKITKISCPGKQQMSLKWKKVSGISGYQFYFSLSKNFKRNTVQCSYSKSKSSVKIDGFPSKKTFYVKMRPYKKSGKKTLYGKWSKVKKIKIK